MEPRESDDTDDGAVDAIVAGLGLREFVETEATTDEHAATVAGFISDAAAEMARFEDTREAT